MSEKKLVVTQRDIDLTYQRLAKTWGTLVLLLDAAGRLNKLNPMFQIDQTDATIVSLETLVYPPPMPKPEGLWSLMIRWYRGSK